jgi:hypothetical protein
MSTKILLVDLVFVGILLLAIKDASAKDIYISLNGTSDDDCGNYTCPCSIQWEGLSNGKSGKGPNDRFIFFDGVYILNDTSTHCPFPSRCNLLDPSF